MANLYSEIGQNARKVFTASDVTGPDTTWLVVDNNDANFEIGAGYDPELTTAGSTNFKAIVECIQTYCEVYEVVRPSTGIMSIKVRHSSVPYAAGEARNDQNANTILTAILQAHPDLGANYIVYNGAFQDDDINWD